MHTFIAFTLKQCRIKISDNTQKQDLSGNGAINYVIINSFSFKIFLLGFEGNI